MLTRLKISEFTDLNQIEFISILKQLVSYPTMDYWLEQLPVFYFTLIW